MRDKMPHTMERNEIRDIILATKDLDVDRVLIVPIQQWSSKILTEKRKQILLTLRTHDVTSEQHLATILGRSRPNVVSDLNLLEHFGLIELRKDGNRTVPILLKTKIVISMDVPEPDAFSIPPPSPQSPPGKRDILYA